MSGSGLGLCCCVRGFVGFSLSGCIPESEGRRGGWGLAAGWLGLSWRCQQQSQGGVRAGLSQE
eukprot:2057396-Alexandrium_andersonii.AAC.1